MKVYSLVFLSFFCIATSVFAADEYLVLGELSEKLSSCDAKKASNAADEMLSKSENALFPFFLPIIAEKLYVVGRKDESVFWLSLHLLRQRYLLTFLKRESDLKYVDSAATYIPILNYGMQNLDTYIATTKKVLVWDKSHPNPLQTRPGFTEFSPKMEAISDKFLQDRIDLLKYKENRQNYERSISDKAQSQIALFEKCKN